MVTCIASVQTDVDNSGNSKMSMTGKDELALKKLSSQKSKMASTILIHSSVVSNRQIQSIRRRENHLETTIPPGRVVKNTALVVKMRALMATQTTMNSRTLQWLFH